jgi:hypothetical protein
MSTLVQNKMAAISESRWSGDCDAEEAEVGDSWLTGSEK